MNPNSSAHRLYVWLAQSLLCASALAQGTNFTPLTINNPNPAPSNFFGISVAAVGADRVLIGAQGSRASGPGAAYLFRTNGALLTTFTSPTAKAGDSFGGSVAAVGTDRVLIGARGYETERFFPVGAAFLFSTSGSLITTFTNPTPVQFETFGSSVAAVGTDRVLIGDNADQTGGIVAGAAYLFSTNGTLLTTFTNPTPAAADNFGLSVAAVGNNRVLIGAQFDDTSGDTAGAAYLFSTNGALITTFTNPMPGGAVFGASVAGVGADRVLVGATFNDLGANDAGAAYLFSTNGMLLTTFTNPAPAPFANFGVAVAAVGSDRVLIATGATDAGAAYLFSTNGALLATFNNPEPEIGDSFGISVAGVGNHSVLIGASRKDTGVTNAGAAYLFFDPNAKGPPTLPFFSGLRAEVAHQLTIASNSLPASKKLAATLRLSLKTIDRTTPTLVNGSIALGTLTKSLGRTALSNTFLPILTGVLTTYIDAMGFEADVLANRLGDTIPGTVRTAAQVALDKFRAALNDAHINANLTLALRSLSKAAKAEAIARKAVVKAESAPPGASFLSATITESNQGVTTFRPTRLNLSATYDTSLGQLYISADEFKNLGAGRFQGRGLVLDTHLAGEGLHNLSLTNSNNGNAFYQRLILSGINLPEPVEEFYEVYPTVDSVNGRLGTGTLIVTLDLDAGVAWGEFTFTATGYNNSNLTVSITGTFLVRLEIL